jgi:hemolysin-activating ACP:hemolysin acyltransferase
MLEFHENENYWAVLDTESPIFKTYEFMIECAVYCINEGQVHFDTYEDDDGKPLAFWALVDKSLHFPVKDENDDGISDAEYFAQYDYECNPD